MVWVAFCLFVPSPWLVKAYGAPYCLAACQQLSQTCHGTHSQVSTALRWRAGRAAGSPSSKFSFGTQESPQLLPPWPAQMSPTQPQLSPSLPQLSPQQGASPHAGLPVARQLPFSLSGEAAPLQQQVQQSSAASGSGASSSVASLALWQQLAAGMPAQASQALAAGSPVRLIEQQQQQQQLPGFASQPSLQPLVSSPASPGLGASMPSPLAGLQNTPPAFQRRMAEKVLQQQQQRQLQAAWGEQGLCTHHDERELEEQLRQQEQEEQEILLPPVRAASPPASARKPPNNVRVQLEMDGADRWACSRGALMGKISATDVWARVWQVSKVSSGSTDRWTGPGPLPTGRIGWACGCP